MKKIFCIIFFAFCSPFLHATAFDAEPVLKNEWKDFSKKYPSLMKFSPDKIATLASEWGKKTAKTLSVSEKVRDIDSTAVKKLIALLREGEPKVFMRHGEQQKTEEVQKLSAELQKIEMMRLPNNLENALTKASAAEWIEGMIIWKYLKQKTKRHFALESSKNRRAELPANALALALKTNVAFNENLNCVNYPPSSKMSSAEILKLLPDGTLPWEQQKVDAIVSPGTYEHISQEMKTPLSPRNGANTVSIAITHTQQTNAIAALSGLPVTRLGNFGFIVLTDKHNEVFADGFYKK